MVRKRAPGGGRKPKGAVATKPMAVRMPDDVRAELEAAMRRRRAGWTLTDELVGRLRGSFARERAARRDPGLQAIMELISEAGDRTQLHFDPEWHREKFAFASFKAAVAKLLDKLAPGAELIEPRDLTENEKKLLGAYLDLTPEMAGDLTAGTIINDLLRRGLHDKWDVASNLRKKKAKNPDKPWLGELLDHIEGVSRSMARVRRDLGIKEPKFQGKGD
jgi:hypothetical protein